MGNATLDQLRAKSEAAWRRVTTQVEGMDAHLDRAAGPGEWTTREVLSHLLGQEGWEPAAGLGQFAERDFPTLDIHPGDTCLTPARRAMTLRQLLGALDAQRREVFAYLEGVPEADLHARKLRIPLFKQFMGTDAISLAVFVGAMFDFHWRDHAGQLAKNREAAGPPGPA
jgi:hypothetical protein